MAGQYISWHRRCQRASSNPRSLTIAARTAAESETSARKPSADARIISCSSLNANSIAAPSARLAGRAWRNTPLSMKFGAARTRLNRQPCLVRTGDVKVHLRK
ncbi:hypothetical protein D9M69_486870 [compost metagenome]